MPAPAGKRAAAAPDTTRRRDLLVVGIGASAGGLEALDTFLKHTPARPGVAFVVVQHLAPTHKDIMVELLQRATSMPVMRVKDRLKIEPDHVYVIPPNKEMSILHGVLHLLPLAATRGLNLPIDHFFRSLAEDQQALSIGVLLSGMGSDGTLGLRAIKEKAGAAFVQSPASAKFDGMPRSAIDAGLADVVAPVEELPARILRYRQHATRLARPEVELKDKDQSALEKVFILLRTRTGNDFSLYKKSTIHRRIERRMGLHQIDDIGTYVRYLRENAGELDLLFKELLIGVTSFFRDPQAWDHLALQVLPELFAELAEGTVLRAWVPGCSTGEEAYSLAMIFKEAVERLKPPRNVGVQIFATDLDKDAIEVARLGFYPANIAADVSPERLRRFFVSEERGYRVSKGIRELVVFAPQNVVMDPPFTRLDILSCRNLLIYLSAELQKRLIPLFHYSLNPGGILFLGTAETIGSFSNLFAPLDERARIYRRRVTIDAPTVEFPTRYPTRSLEVPSVVEGAVAALAPPPNLQALVHELLVERFSPPGVLCSEKGALLFVSGRVSRYLETATGKANLNIFAMARAELRYELSTAFNAALRQDGAVTVRGLAVGTNGGTQTINLSVERLSHPEPLRGTVLVAFMEAPAPVEPGREKSPRRSGRAASELLLQLERAREDTQLVREQMQTSQEELKSTNEELQSTNEELQSSNEELTTSKEEMQSLNEELQLVNGELQSKVTDLARSNNDMKNLMNSTDIATLFLDTQLRVRRFTDQTAKLFTLIQSDIGRFITDFTSELEYPELTADSREVLRTLASRERVVAARGGAWYTVRILPYRTVDNVIDGVVLTFTDATAAKKLEETLRGQAGELKQMAESLPGLVWGARPDGFCDYLSRQWIEYTGIPEAEQLGFGWFEQLHPEDRERAREAWRSAVKAGAPLNLELRIRGKTREHRWFKVRAVPIRDPKGAILRWYGTDTDIDDVKTSATSREQASFRLTGILDGISDPFLALDRDLKVAFFNVAAERLFGRPRDEVVGKVLREVIPGAQGSILEARCRLAVEKQESAFFDLQLEIDPLRGHYSVRIYAHANGASVFLPRDGGGGA